MPYDRAVLVNVLIYHQRTATSGCGCGWAVLGASHAEHVADVYEQSIAALEANIGTDDAIRNAPIEESTVVAMRVDERDRNGMYYGWECKQCQSSTGLEWDQEHVAEQQLREHLRTEHGAAFLDDITRAAMTAAGIDVDKVRRGDPRLDEEWYEYRDEDAGIRVVFGPAVDTIDRTTLGWDTCTYELVTAFGDKEWGEVHQDWDPDAAGALRTVAARIGS